MLPLQKLLLRSLALSMLSSLTTAASCGGIVGALASAVSGFPEAQSFCSSKFPMPAQTVTASAATSTVTATNTAISTISTATITTTASTVVSVVTSTSIETDTVVDIVTSTSSTTTIVAKRSVSSTNTLTTTARTVSTTTGNAKSSLLSNLISAANAVAQSICYCIESPKTTTVTPPATSKTITVTVTQLSTGSATSTVTSTSLSTESVTITSTTTTKSVSLTISTVASTFTPANVVPCDYNARGDYESGGCTNCYCEADINGRNAYCTSAQGSQQQCSSDLGCPVNEFCFSGICVNSQVSPRDSSLCHSTYTGSSSKRSLFGIFEGAKFGRFKARRPLRITKKKALGGS